MNNESLQKFENHIWLMIQDFSRGKFTIFEIKDIILSLIVIRYISIKYNNHISLDFKEVIRGEPDNLVKNIKKITELIKNKIPELQVDLFEPFKFFLSRIFFNDSESIKSLWEICYELNNVDFKIFEIQPDKLFVKIFDYLLIQFSESNFRGVDFSYTPKNIVNLIINVIKPKNGETIYDPTCGTGGFLISAGEYIKNNYPSFDKINVYGQEINIDTAKISKLNMFIHGYNESNICIGNSLLKPCFIKTNKSLETFDIVLSNPPFSVNPWYGNNVDLDLIKSFCEYGIPPKSNSDFAFIQLILGRLKDNGRAAIIMPSGTLFRGGLEGKIRKDLIENNHIETVISLPSNSFSGTTIANNILILKRQRQQSDIFFINSSKVFEKQNMNNPKIGETNYIAEIYNERKDLDGIAKLIPKAQIVENNYILNLSKFIPSIEVEYENTIESIVEKQLELENKLLILQKQMHNYIYKLK